MKKKIVIAIIATLLATLLGVPQEVAKLLSEQAYCATTNDCPKNDVSVEKGE